MGLHRCFVRLTRNTASITQWMYPFRAFATQGDEVQPAREFVSVEIRLLSGNHTIVRVVSPSPWLERCRAVTLFTQLTLHSYCGQQLAVAAVLCCAMLCCAMLCCAALRCAVLPALAQRHRFTPSFMGNQNSAHLLSICPFSCLVQESSQQLRAVFNLVSSQTGTPPSCQTVVVSETRCSSRGLSAVIKDIAHSWEVRQSTRSLMLGLINYMFLPQVMGR